MKQAILVVGDDDKLYKNPRLAGMVDEDLCEFFIAFTPTQAPEIVIERIPNYPPHRGMAAPALWVWYAKAAAAILAQLKIPATKIQKCLSCTREFEGVNQDARRPAKGISFTFDLCGPLPVASISKDEGVFEYEDCLVFEGKPEGSFAVLVEEGFEPHLVKDDFQGDEVCGYCRKAPCICGEVGHDDADAGLPNEDDGIMG